MISNLPNIVPHPGPRRSALRALLCSPPPSLMTLNQGKKQARDSGALPGPFCCGDKKAPFRNQGLDLSWHPLGSHFLLEKEIQATHRTQETEGIYRAQGVQKVTRFCNQKQLLQRGTFSADCKLCRELQIKASTGWVVAAHAFNPST